MRTVREQARDTPVVGEYDVCIIGGSCTGVFAAIRAARLGAKVAIIESNGFFGGTATASLVCIWHSIYDTTHERQIIAGLTTEVLDRLTRRRAVHLLQRNEWRYAILNTEELKIELDEMVVEAGVRPFLHTVTVFASPVLQDGRLAAVAVEDKTGRRAIAASYVVDATGDGDVAARMGLPCYKRPAMQPPTTCLTICGIKEIEDRYPGFSLERAAFDARYPQALKRGWLRTADVPGATDDAVVNGTRIFGVDCSDADDLTQAEIEGRRQARAMCDILRENFPLPESVPLVALPAKIGIRETRHVRCQHTLTEQGVLSGTRFPDAIANGSYRVDIHNAHGPGIVLRYLDGREERHSPAEPVVMGRWRPDSHDSPTLYQIPYRSLVPRGATNLLVAGRMIDADEGAFGAARVMVNCNQMGEAAGAASYLALNGHSTVADVPIGKLRETLTAEGAIIV